MIKITRYDLREFMSIVGVFLNVFIEVTEHVLFTLTSNSRGCRIGIRLLVKSVHVE